MGSPRRIDATPAAARRHSVASPGTGDKAMTALRKIEQAKSAVVMPTRPTDISVNLIQGGRMRQGTVSTRLPYDMWDRSRFFPAPRLPCATETLEAVRNLATRCVPWVQVLVGPRLWSYNDPEDDLTAFCNLMVSPDGRIMHEIGGQAWSRPHVPDGSPEAILLSIWGSTKGALSIFHHEAWHVVEYHLAPEDFDVVDAAVGAGHAMLGKYLDSAIERRARVYQAWANAHDEGWRPTTLFGVPLSRVDRVFLSDYRGDVAADRAAGRPSPARFSPAKRPLGRRCGAPRGFGANAGGRAS